MQLGSDVQIRDGLLAENTLLREKPRLGFERTETTVHQASIRLNYLNGNRVSSIVVFQSRQVSLMAQQQGSGTAGTIYNETSTLREDGKTVGPDLHNARVAIAQVIDVNHSTAKVASSTVQDNLKYPPAAAAMKDSQAAVSEAATAPNGTQGATHFFLAGGNTPTPAWVSQGKVVESFGPFPVVANTHDFSKGQSATIQIIQYPVPKQ